ncbi:M23 family metallopeptidase [Lacihabitans sp. LS3-19]|uniref:M23 family metallopeptidase n=1 Tax=Lacihabitans sp. LS3-19 TaxID=2487335 RepID=UPI0020CBA520|nr:M23 family metallopeptidase [Lacihabitans sp. LS3-19]MCP9767233.1 M23 family metallopeptidase [Lacihabitans sp. LS3-19]
MKKILLLFSLISIVAKAQQDNFQCLSAQELKSYKEHIKSLKYAYLNSNPEAAKANARVRGSNNHHILLGWPLQSSSDYDFTYNNFTISNFVDQNANSDPEGDDDVREPEWIDDYNCGKRTYDGHDAEDIGLFPFAWRMMDNESVQIVAAAPGIILTKRTGNFDKNCEWAGAGNANYVSLLHDDGTITNYYHMKNGSVTSKSEDDRVEEGEYLGLVGSSGRSTGPHLHFSVYDTNDDLIDPFTGNCNSLNNDSWWKVQRPYREPMINRIMTHTAPPDFGVCPSEEITFEANQFASGSFFHISVAFKDIQALDVSSFELIKPNGDTYSTWFHQFPQERTGFLYVSTHQLPDANTGTWIIKIVYKNKNYYHFFTVGCNSTKNILGNVTGSKGYIAGNTISSSAEHFTNDQTRVLYQANEEIVFTPGFEIKSGATMKARIKACDYVD